LNQTNSIKYWTFKLLEKKKKLKNRNNSKEGAIGNILLG